MNAPPGATQRQGRPPGLTGLRLIRGRHKAPAVRLTDARWKKLKRPISGSDWLARQIDAAPPRMPEPPLGGALACAWAGFRTCASWPGVNVYPRIAIAGPAGSSLVALIGSARPSQHPAGQVLALWAGGPRRPGGSIHALSRSAASPATTSLPIVHTCAAGCLPRGVRGVGVKAVHSTSNFRPSVRTSSTARDSGVVLMVLCVGRGWGRASSCQVITVP